MKSNTFPNEQLAIGPVMMETILTSELVDIISLGAQLPLAAIAAATLAYRADIVAVYFSETLSNGLICQGLKDLRRSLSSDTIIWASGSGAAQICHPPEGITILRSLPDLENAVVAWRAETRSRPIE